MTAKEGLKDMPTIAGDPFGTFIQSIRKKIRYLGLAHLHCSVVHPQRIAAGDTKTASP